MANKYSIFDDDATQSRSKQMMASLQPIVLVRGRYWSASIGDISAVNATGSVNNYYSIRLSDTAYS